ncbi:hypothetical protein CQ062_22430 [Ochrobactrum sp. MYb68]|nr:hypothetical protein CQ062_22430 [Ochrobactrum sp. MYb68]
MLKISLKSLVRSIYTLANIIDFKAARRAKCDATMLMAFKAGDIEKVESCIVKFSEKNAPSTWAVTFYIGKVVYQGRAKKLEELLASKKVRSDHLPLLISASHRVAGNYVEALKALRYNSTSSLVRYKTAQAERSIHHQMQNWEAKAVAAVEYIKSEPERKLLEFSLHAAGSAENAARPDLERIALNRAISDMRAVKASSRLIRKHWKEAAFVSQHIFDIRGAATICRRAAKLGCKGANAEFKRLSSLLEESEPIKKILGLAYRDMRVRAGELEPVEDAADVEIVMHAAALRENKIDYKGFRTDIRFCYEVIGEILEQHHLKMRVRGKLLVHGDLNRSIPYFSYHTLANNEFGLHFKEVDRPGSFSFDRRGYSGWAKIAESRIADLGLEKIDAKIAEEFFTSDAKKIISRGASKYKQSSDIDEGLPETYIFIGLQVVGDAVQSLAFMSATAMIEEVLVTANRLNLPVVIKRHPYCKSAFLANYLEEGRRTGRFSIASGNIHKLISRSVAVCVVNSAVGSEALLHNKPVYVFGKCEYMKACFVCSKKGDFDRMFVLNKRKLSKTKLYRFWYYLKNLYAIDVASTEEGRENVRRMVLDHLKYHKLIA